MDSFKDWSATRVIATTIGVVFGFSGVNHGLFEFLQGNRPTDGLVIKAIGEGQRMWPLASEEAFTIIPNFMVTGLLAMLAGLAIVIWSIWFLPGRHGRSVFLGLFILLFLVGGGIGQIVFFIPAWAFATRIDRPLDRWAKVLPPQTRPFLSRLWIVTLILSTLLVLTGIEVAIFGYFPGVSDPELLQNVGLLLVLASAILNVLTFVAGIGHDLKRLVPGN